MFQGPYPDLLLLYLPTCYYQNVKFSIDHKSRISLHIQAEESLYTMTSDPEHLSGKFLPNVVELAE